MIPESTVAGHFDTGVYAEMSRQQQRLEDQLRYQVNLNRITNRIHSAGDTNEILIGLHRDLLDFFDADRLTIYLVDTNRGEIYSKIKTGDEVSEIRVPINVESLAGYCALSGRTLNIRDVYDNDELKAIDHRLTFDRTWDQRTGYRTRQVLVAPITYNRYLLGIVQLMNRRGGQPFSETDQSSVEDIARVLGIAFYKNQKASQRSRPTKFDFLISSSILTEADLSEAVSLARKAGKSVESVLMSDFHVSKESIGRSLSNHFRTRFVSYDPRMPIPAELLKNLNARFLRNNLFVPVGRSEGKVMVAMENPDDLSVRDAIGRVIEGMEVEYCVSLREEILEMIDMFFRVRGEDGLMDSGSIEEILGQLRAPEEEDDETEGMREDDSAIVQLVNKTIMDAYNRKASDIHIEPRQARADTIIRFRIDGECQVYQTIPYTYKKAIVSRIKIMSDLDISERRRPQDGKIKFRKFAPLDLELRVATIPTAGENEDVVMRLLASGDPIPLEKMEMSPETYQTLVSMITRPHGIFLVVGPTGSGKTTTLHAALAHINRPETKIWTAEDPVEITQEGLRQVQVLPRIGFDFASAMRAFLRADPDVIMVGEMRDQETLSMGIEASLTGHLVLTTLHTNSAPETITRLLDMGMDPFNFADALLGVLAQRLVRTLCEECKKPYHPETAEFEALVRAYEGDFDQLGIRNRTDLTLFRAKGCPLCGNTGYRGRTGIHELLKGTDEIKALMQKRARTEDLRAQAVRDGMSTLMQDGIRKVCLGLTDFSQVRRVCMR
ncbi:MAG: GspE/PulE family protein [Deltaproteobacteria bacterium]|nr:GspE/PulE family protein [Deltaproteobacteria bacterium]MBW2048788.1 GspE/PulE family protein [Deltaproteobacteria bacterium]MBW2111266.1 GspE/PulE family protein [Deltaproteobacteria bacterium]MBW2353861.1 GspE/PulE family protein [Deltaproteobacteria bacterium]